MLCSPPPPIFSYYFICFAIVTLRGLLYLDSFLQEKNSFSSYLLVSKYTDGKRQNPHEGRRPHVPNGARGGGVPYQGQGAAGQYDFGRVRVREEGKHAPTRMNYWLFLPGCGYARPHDVYSGSNMCIGMVEAFRHDGFFQGFAHVVHTRPRPRTSSRLVMWERAGSRGKERFWNYWLFLPSCACPNDASTSKNIFIGMAEACHHDK